MIEMLGVLAIIGVLSVGGIAGYSKAMFKYRLNKQAESMNMLIINAMDFMKSLAPANTDTSLGYFDAFYKLNLIPENITKKNETYLQDIFKNSIWMFSHTQSAPYSYGIGYSLTSEFNKDLCYNLINVAKGFAGELWYFTTDMGSTPDDPQRILFQGYGNQYCGDNGKKCLSHLDLNQIEQACHQCEDISRCRFYFVWH